MSRNKNNRQAAQYGYNRQSKGYQQNLYKQRLKEEKRQTDRQLLLRAGCSEGWAVSTIAHLPDR